MAGIQYTLVVIAGPIILLAIILFAVMRNRTTRAQDDRTDRATRELYKQSSADDEARTPLGSRNACMVARRGRLVSAP